MIEEIQNKFIQIIYSTLFEVQLSIFTISHSPNRFNYCNDFKKKKIKEKKNFAKGWWWIILQQSDYNVPLVVCEISAPSE